MDSSARSLFSHYGWWGDMNGRPSSLISAFKGRPRWLSGKCLGWGRRAPAVRDLTLTKIRRVYGACCTLNHMRAKRPPAGAEV
ncbi:hypothetical protein AVEN_242859-1 [Araneus ventricosus]|uniref:Uncharacterized protein n=1 Tax=Araneus ventricosus TaxID=182803 RepID=A0A4Y1ZR36_ARAVE|nr:hypothetical protein AVEN_242859-1 [Araneus ventricosus]